MGASKPPVKALERSDHNLGTVPGYECPVPGFHRRLRRGGGFLGGQLGKRKETEKRNAVVKKPENSPGVAAAVAVAQSEKKPGGGTFAVKNEGCGKDKPPDAQKRGQPTGKPSFSSGTPPSPGKSQGGGPYQCARTPKGEKTLALRKKHICSPQQMRVTNIEGIEMQRKGNGLLFGGGEH